MKDLISAPLHSRLQLSQLHSIQQCSTLLTSNKVTLQPAKIIHCQVFFLVFFYSFPNSSEHNGLRPRPGPHLRPRVCCNADMQGRWSIRPGGHHLDIHMLWKMLRTPTGNAAVNHDGSVARRRWWKPYLFGGGRCRQHWEFHH